MTEAGADPLATSGLVIVDKPQGMTSHDVVSKLRRIFNTKKVGHAGTLDPMATGTLIVGIERGTKFLAHLSTTTKSYTATIRLGMTTTTDDKEGEELTRTDASKLDETAIRTAVATLTGTIMQRPATVSAIKIAGKRAYERVLAGEKVELPERPVTITRFDVLTIRHDTYFVDVDVLVDCSAGTYIRALARDLGEKLQVGGHLTALRRTAVGPFDIADAATLEQLAESPRLSLSLDAALIRCYPTFDVTAAEARDLALGKWLEPRGLVGIHAAVAPNGQAIALIKEQGKRLATVFVARPSTL